MTTDWSADIRGLIRENPRPTQNKTLPDRRLGAPRGRARANDSQRGIALLLVVSVLTVVAIMGVAFVFSMYLETQAARQFAATTHARYIAEAGVSHARALLDEDRLGSRIDDLTESWAHDLAGADADVDGDDAVETRWWLLTDPANETVGHYAVLIRDEAGKANLNTAGSDGVNLASVLAHAGIEDAQRLAEAIERARDGPDGKPGVALVDDDHDGAVDEPDEYQVLALRGDDRRFERLEELLDLAGLDVDRLRQLTTVATVYSWDPNLSLMGQSRLNVNTATAEELLGVLLATGGDNLWQLAANLADYTDPDVAMSRLTKVVAEYDITSGEVVAGDWVLTVDPVTHYTTTIHPGEPLSWVVPMPSGTFYVFVRGVQGMVVGDVSVAGQTTPLTEHGSFIGIVPVSDSLTIQVTCPEEAGTCAFRGLEVAAAQGGSGLPETPIPVRGIEAIRINELMVAPTKDLTVEQAVFAIQNSTWACQGGSCFNSGTGQASWTWGTGTVPPGFYHVRVYGQPGQTVGEVTVNSRTQTLVHGARHAEVLSVSEGGPITIGIGKTPADRTYYFQMLTLSVEPDAEYVELVNLSDQDIDVSGWLIEGEAVEGRQGRLPSGAVVKAHGVLAAAVDVDDAQTGLSGNHISAKSVWQVPAEAGLVQLEFPGGALTPDADWLKMTLAEGTQARLVLRTKEGWLVDEVEYPLTGTLPDPFQSLEKADPSVIEDEDHDGLDEGWHFSLAPNNTPGLHNDNYGLDELRGSTRIEHDPAREVTVLNRPLGSIGELAGLPSGTAWRAVSSEDLAGFVDRLTVEGIRVETEGRLIDGQEAWQEVVDGYEANTQDAQATWRWEDVPDGPYRLSLYGWSGEQVSVRWQPGEDGAGDWSPALSADAQGRVVVGQVTVGPPASASQTLTLQVRCASPSGVCHLNHVWLDPQLILTGRININTAPPEVLRSLPGVTETVLERVLAARPFGDQDRKARGIGDLLVGSILGDTEEDKLERFRQLAHLVTVRSQVFEIMSLGEALEGDRPSAAQRIHAIIQR